MIANPRFDAGRFRAPADDTVSVLLEKGIGGKLADLAAGGAEEIDVDVIGDAGRFDITVHTLIEMVMTGNVVLLDALDADVSTFPIGSISRLILGKRLRFADVGENSRKGILCTPSVNSPRKQSMSFRTRSVTHGKSFLRASSREKRYLTYVNFPFLSSPLIDSRICD
jgi:hypothetical protein